MPINQNTPDQWQRFVNLVKQNMPAPPQTSRTRTQERQTNVARSWNQISTLLDTLGVSVPGFVGNLITAGTSGSAVDAAQSMAEALALGMLGGGAIATGAVETVRGASQQLDRTYDMLFFFLSTMGYLKTLGRLSASSVVNRRHDMAYPNPVIPPDVHQSGAIYSNSREEMYHHGFNKAWQVVTEMDRLRPADRSRDRFSKVCFIHIFVQTGETNVTRLGETRIANLCSQTISREILNLDLNRHRQTLRRWATSGR